MQPFVNVLNNLRFLTYTVASASIKHFTDVSVNMQEPLTTDYNGKIYPLRLLNWNSRRDKCFRGRPLVIELEGCSFLHTIPDNPILL